MKSYHPEFVETVRTMCADGADQNEIGARLGVSRRVIHQVMKENGIVRRGPVKAKNRGERNGQWRGGEATYAAFHYRVSNARGKPQQCEDGGRTDSGTRYEWANVSGNFADLNDYRRLCVACHRRFDRAARNLGIDVAYKIDAVCGVPSCSGAVHARGRCRRHYGAARWLGTLDEAPDAVRTTS